MRGRLSLIYNLLLFWHFLLSYRLKLPTVDTFLNYLPLEIGGYVVASINLLANVFAAILQLRTTISANLKEFHGKEENPKSSKLR